MRISPYGAMRRNGARFALLSVGKRGYQTLLLRLSAVLRNAVAMCRPLITPDNRWHKTTWPEFQPSLPPGLRGQRCYPWLLSLLRRSGVQCCVACAPYGVRGVDPRMSRQRLWSPVGGDLVMCTLGRAAWGHPTRCVPHRRGLLPKNGHSPVPRVRWTRQLPTGPGGSEG